MTEHTFRVVLVLSCLFSAQSAFAVPANQSALNAEKIQALDQYLAKKGLLSSGAPPPNVDLKGRARDIVQQVERAKGVVTNNTVALVQGLNRLTELSLKMRKPAKIIYDDGYLTKEIVNQAVRECCTLRGSGSGD